MIPKIKPKNKKDRTEKQLWDIFSKFTRLRDANYQGYVKCISCNTIKFWKEMDAGHYIAVGANKSLKYYEKNVNAQCTVCNKYKHGNLIEYRRGLVEKYGEKEVKCLEAISWMKKTGQKLQQWEINTLYYYYYEKVEELSQRVCLN